MYFCLNCESRFEDPVISQWGEVVTRVCHYCKIDDYKLLTPCKQCSELGDQDKYCQSCETECQNEINTELAKALHDFKMRWDAELVDECIAKWIEDI